MARRWPFGFLVPLLLSACAEDLGPCNETQARRLVYTDDEAGLPAYAGQALIRQSCGEGAFCHSPGIPFVDRYGAPAGLDFDLSLATDATSVERLRDGQSEIYAHRSLVMQTLERGTMPPRGVGATVVDAATRYRDLPAIDTPEGRAIVRNWLACRAPLVERLAEDWPAGVEPVGVAVPAAPQGDCDAGRVMCADGCTDLSTDGASCGGCGLACPSGATCEAGACTGCVAGLAACGDACVDLGADGRNCGACGVVCGAGEVCAGGSCSMGGCPSDTTACSGSCVSLQTNASHCGACDRACAAGEACIGGVCDCGDTSSDPTNCGACGNACAVGQACVGGSCTCAAGTTSCGGACVDVTRDSANCGGCGVRCGAGESCTGGVCQRCGDGISFASDVQPIFTNGCGGNTCHSGARPSSGLDLTAGRAFGELVNVPSEQCGGRVRVVPSDPDASYLMAKLLGVGLCRGTRMPKADQPLSTAELDLVRDWICGGARND